jgi:exopolyphosphatase / guanosine-5'-triphosphate,3'-diphosphate pyrophosphatase
MKVAVIDLGTNTCNLLIAEMDSFGYEILHQSKQLVKLGDDKIRQNEISAAATSRVMESFQTHKKIIRNYEAEKVRVVATSAVRTAENKIEFLEQVSENCGWLVRLISGEKEAEMIFEGVLLAFNEFKNPSLILDIGGGSNELILAHNKKMLWKESQPTGMARVINRFKISDPIQPVEIGLLQNYYFESHKTALEKCKAENVKTLVGCSGAFDTIADMIDQVNPGEKMRKTQEISISDFYEVFEKLIKSTREQRLLMKGMDMVRVDLIVPAVILIEHLISEIGITSITQTDYALREGVLFEMMNFSQIKSDQKIN